MLASKWGVAGVGRTATGVIAVFVGFCLTVTAFGGSIELVPRRAPIFDIKIRDGSSFPNTNYEAHEQAGLFKNWDSSYDTGINIGVYVGTSCVFLDRLLEGNGHAPSKARTACVEPNTMILPTMLENLKLQKRPFVQVMHGIVADQEHCPEGAALLDGRQHDAAQANVSAPLMSWAGMHGDADKFRVERCFTFDGIKAAFGGKLPAVWYVDCDGCLPAMYSQFSSHFADPSVKMLLYEREALPGTTEPDHVWEAKYRAMEKNLRAQGFVAKQCLSNSLWGVWVWQRDSYRFTVQVWCLALWAAFLIGAAWCTDQLAQKLPVHIAVPVWRLVVLSVWLNLYRRLPVMPFNLKEPITGLDCTWNCTHEALGFSLSNYIFIYVAVLWGAAKACQPQQPWLAFLCATQTSIVLGLMREGLRRAQLEPLCKGPGPQRGIWEMTVITTVILSIVAQFQGRATCRSESATCKEGAGA